MTCSDYYEKCYTCWIWVFCIFAISTSWFLRDNFCFKQSILPLLTVKGVTRISVLLI
ncbi:hypothetical protein [Wolbachia endosymbiont (group A) of Brachyopa scutellaris]|uniref:hypothetical protein n=1 Tax=Wolbachia endosymbiont (group A) of Brachyopa scutellaris TaxID=3066140 RepID=UPI00313327A7